ncbi:sensor histidine kinase [Clostridium akagii]|uniref:sensor histidine kinase n=1 Tax=Clostridium akagii TaxID=91623 RepID=UPI00068C2832|nr:HAMP domain-containing sensor histidine kinase [Clostridium akagii]
MNDNFYKPVIGKSLAEKLKIKIKEKDDKSKRIAELIMANKEIKFQSGEKEERAAELIIANKEIAFQSGEKEERAAELIIANREIAFQSVEKAERAAELIIANKELTFQNEEKGRRAAELIIANKELTFQNEEKEKRAAELIIANKELAFQSREKAERAAELIIANKELIFQNEEKGKRAAELILANKELTFQNEEKGKRAAELIIANRVQGEFFVNISHELKTPLNVIFSTVQLFDMYCKSGLLDKKQDSIIKYTGSIKQNCYRLSKLINNIVDLSKIEAGFFKLNLSNNNIIDVVEKLVTSVTSFTESKNLSIVFDTNVEEKIIAFDLEKIERIVLNLISNAIKFSDAGDEIFVEVSDRNEFVEISVKDNGIGIGEKDLDIIFDRFKQVDNSLSRNTEGTGIGLSLVKSIAELHGGSIDVKSEVGVGSTFTVVLPSKNVSDENMIYDSNMKNRNESIKVELSDIYS